MTVTQTRGAYVWLQAGEGNQLVYKTSIVASPEVLKVAKKEQSKVIEMPIGD